MKEIQREVWRKDHGKDHRELFYPRPTSLCPFYGARGRSDLASATGRRRGSLRSRPRSPRCPPGPTLAGRAGYPASTSLPSLSGLAPFELSPSFALPFLRTRQISKKCHSAPRSIVFFFISPDAVTPSDQVTARVWRRMPKRAKPKTDGDTPPSNEVGSGPVRFW